MSDCLWQVCELEDQLSVARNQVLTLGPKLSAAQADLDSHPSPPTPTSAYPNTSHPPPTPAPKPKPPSASTLRALHDKLAHKTSRLAASTADAARLSAALADLSARTATLDLARAALVEPTAALGKVLVDERRARYVEWVGVAGRAGAKALVAGLGEGRTGRLGEVEERVREAEEEVARWKRTVGHVWEEICWHREQGVDLRREAPYAKNDLDTVEDQAGPLRVALVR